MKELLRSLMGILLWQCPAHCQYYFYDANRLEPEWRVEAGVSIGMMNCLTDLGGHKGNGKKLLKDVNWNFSRPCGGIYFSATHRDILGIQLKTIWGTITASDSVLKSLPPPASLRYLRNLHFKSKLAEITTSVEFHPLFIAPTNNPLFSPYLFVGIGFFRFQPRAFIDGGWVKLQPLRTEGQGFKELPEQNVYKLKQLNIPLGLGCKYEISHFLVLRMSLEYRILLTDYLDDVSCNYIDPSLFHNYFSPEQARLAERLADRSVEMNGGHQNAPGSIRGNSTNNDAYFSVNAQLGIIFNRRRI